jgi:hypothetical protein
MAPKAYRPIADNLNKLAERWDLLPNNHFGGRRGRTMTDSMHTLTSFIKDAWHLGDVVAGLFLDISGAFPNASPTMLAHAMKRKGVPEGYIRWAERKLEGRTTILRFDNYTSDEFIIQHGIDQGCPLSCIFYLFYNSGLIEVAEVRERRRGMWELVVGYIDDVVLLVRASTMEEATGRIKEMVEREGGALDWAKRHTSDFGLEKTALIGFTKKKEQKAKEVEIGGTVIKPAEYHCFLGVIFDSELCWREQRAKVIKTGTKWASVLRRVCRTQHGLKPEAARCLHQSVFLPKVTYAADIWWEATQRNQDNTQNLGAAGFTKRLQSAQRISALNITGALHTSPTDALDAHAGILLIELELRKACHRAAI